jgi:hypothetical protein
MATAYLVAAFGSDKKARRTCAVKATPSPASDCSSVDSKKKISLVQREFQSETYD